MAKNKITREGISPLPGLKEILERLDRIDARYVDHFEARVPFNSDRFEKVFIPQISFAASSKLSSGSFDVKLKIHGSNFSKQPAPMFFQWATIFVLVETANNGWQYLQDFPKSVVIDINGQFGFEFSLGKPVKLQVYAVDNATGISTRKHFISINSGREEILITFG